jgi:hypothetical protein
MQIDWYDRSIVSYVLDSKAVPDSGTDSRSTHFGIGTHRLMQRFDAILDVYAAQQLPLDEPDLDLLRRARRYRETAARHGI